MAAPYVRKTTAGVTAPAPGNIVLDTSVLDAMMAELPERTEALLDKFAEDTVTLAKENIRQKHIIDTGALRDSMHWRRNGKAIRVVSDGVDYGIYNEMGTVHMGARPFLGPAIETMRAHIGKYFKGLLGANDGR